MYNNNARDLYASWQEDVKTVGNGCVAGVCVCVSVCVSVCACVRACVCVEGMCVFTTS